jgi:hypothetical protein
VGALKQLGEQGVASVKEELGRLEAEKAQLQFRLSELTTRQAPVAEALAAAKRFVEEFRGLGDILDQAAPDELRAIVQHHVEVIELTCTNPDERTGVYALRLFPEVWSSDAVPPKADGAITGNSGGGPVLTEAATVRSVDEKAPRVGFEPTTNRLTGV